MNIKKYKDGMIILSIFLLIMGYVLYITYPKNINSNIDSNINKKIDESKKIVEYKIPKSINVIDNGTEITYININNTLVKK